MKFLPLTLAALTLVGCDDAKDLDPNRLVERTDFEMPARWMPKEVMGRDFWPLFKPAFWTCDTPEWKPSGERLQMTWPPLEVYRDAALIFDGVLRPVNDIERNYLKRGKGDYRTPVSIFDFYTAIDGKTLAQNPKPGAPVMLELQNQRPAFALAKARYDLDLDGFAAWKRAHPNFVGFRAMSEFDSDSNYYEKKIRTLEDKDLQKQIVDVFGWSDDPEARLRTVKAAVARSGALRFGEEGFWTMFSSIFTLGHQSANYGATGLFYEATSQECGRWQVAGAFQRGAARQFDIPYGWYVATWCTSYTRQGERVTAANGMESNKDASHWPLKGAGRSVADRQQAYGYLIGNTYMEIEGPHRTQMAQKDAKPPTFPSDFAHDLDALYRFSRQHARGGVYSPIAILIPLSTRYVSSGSPIWETDPYAYNPVFYTLCPTYGDLTQNSLRKVGFSSRLYNSKFGEIYDVLVPDSDEEPRKFAEALAAYKAAFLIGDFRKDRLDYAALVGFVKGGGTLFLAADRLLDGLVSPAFTGVAFDGKTVPSAGYAETYAWHVPVGTPTSKPLLKDAAGQVVAWANRLGRGRVVTLAAARFLPAEYAGFTAKERFTVNNEIALGKRRFSLLEELFTRIQRETMPVRVTGDVQWGVNRTKDGWLVWLFNNNGVTKFACEPEEFDATRTAEVEIDVSRIGGAAARDLRADAPLRVADGKCAVSVAPGTWKVVSVGR